ncbi:MAG: CDGSH iron-sulfur domain-containing protein [Candidatus Atabeyarchaeum deiterrae]
MSYDWGVKDLAKGIEKENKPKASVEKRVIKVGRKGPYLVSGGIPLAIQIIDTDAEGTPIEWRTGKKYPPQDDYSLCRCGQTKNKPFCDGTHAKVHFEGTETASQEPYDDRAEVIDGPALVLTDAVDLCARARFCHRAGEIWNLIPLSGDPKQRIIAAKEAGDCPSGRLVIWDKETKRQIEPVFEPSIGLVEGPRPGMSGPVWVRGGIPIESGNGRIYEIRNRVTLCGCGRSRNKPFCDSSHLT